MAWPKSKTLPLKVTDSSEPFAATTVPDPATVNVSAPAGKWPQKITACAQTLRTALAVRVAVRACFPEPARAAAAGVAT